MRMIAFGAALALLLAGPALADGPISTADAGAATPQQSTTPPPALPAPVGAYTEPQRVAMGPCGLEKVKPNGQLETAPHGEVDAGIGTGGYRHVGGTVCQPIGQTGSVTISAGTTQGNWGYRGR